MPLITANYSILVRVCRSRKIKISRVSNVSVRLFILWSLLQDDNSFRVVLATEVRRCVQSENFKNEESMVFFRPQRQREKSFYGECM